MRRITYSMRFHRPAGPASPKPAASKSDASSLPIPVWSAPEKASLLGLTVLEDTGGPTAKPFTKSVGAAIFENSVLIFDSSADGSSGSFLEQCLLTGTGGDYFFGSARPGTFGPAPTGETLQPGCVIWQITGGTKDFQGATGTITSNFLFSAVTGELVDNHLGILYLP